MSIHGSFILFTKQKLNIPALLNTSLGITTFLGGTISKIALVGTKGADIRSASIGGVGTRRVWISGTCIKNFCTKGTLAGGAYIVSASNGNACASSICAKGACVGVKNLIFWDSCIHSFTNSPCKFTVLDLRLLIDLKLDILVSSYFYL